MNFSVVSLRAIIVSGSLIVLVACGNGATVGASAVSFSNAPVPASPSPTGKQGGMASAAPGPTGSPGPQSTSAASSICGSVESAGWVGAWGTAPVTYYTPANAVPYSLQQGDPFVAANEVLDQSIRVIAHPSMSGSLIRLRFSNAYGTQNVVLNSVHVARAVSSTSPATVASSDALVTFNCATSVTIPKGQEITSDPIALSFSHGDNIAVTSYLKNASGFITFHSIADQMNYVNAVGGGDATADVAGTTFTSPYTQSFFLSGIDAYTPDSPGTIVALGDSITDGAFIAPGTNTRWPDVLANILDAHGMPSPVVNEGISGNTVLRYAITPPNGQYLYGDPATDRFMRDVLQRPNVRTLLILEGTNDLSYQGGYNSAANIYAGLVALTNRAHTAGIRNVFVATITPRTLTGEGNVGLLPTSQIQLTALNVLIRSSTIFDGYMEFHDALVDPANPENLNPLYDSGDGLHPNAAGDAVLASVVPFTRFK